MNYSFHPAAKRDLDEAVEYYEDCRPGLGYEFLEDVYVTISRILEYPEAWTQLSSRSRRCLTNRFPYNVIYELKEDQVRIIAVAHTSRGPGYWHARSEG